MPLACVKSRPDARASSVNQSAATGMRLPSRASLDEGGSPAVQPPATAAATKGPIRNNLVTVTADASRLAALLVGRMHSAFSLLAPCNPGASAPTATNLFLTGP